MTKPVVEPASLASLVPLRALPILFAFPPFSTPRILPTSCFCRAFLLFHKFHIYIYIYLFHSTLQQEATRSTNPRSNPLTRLETKKEKEKRDEKSGARGRRRGIRSGYELSRLAPNNAAISPLKDSPLR